MSQPRGSLANKRKRDGKDLNLEDGRIYKLIRSKGGMGILKREIVRELKMMAPKVNNCIKSLLGMQMIKEISDMNSKAMKRYLAADIEPSKNVTGGVWYDDGKLDTVLIDNLKRVSLSVLSGQQKVATADGIRNLIKSIVVNGDLSIEQVEEILDNLILEKLVVKVKSNGLGEFASFPMGVDCYKLKQRGEKTGAMTSIPCGVCPRINHCHPDGIISPTTCEYYTKWLDF